MPRLSDAYRLSICHIYFSLFLFILDRQKYSLDKCYKKLNAFFFLHFTIAASYGEQYLEMFIFLFVYLVRMG